MARTGHGRILGTMIFVGLFAILLWGLFWGMST